MGSDGVDQYFSIIALFILFRETVEASIIVSVLLQFLSRSFPSLKKQVWWGVAAGVGGSIIFGIIFVCIYYVARDNVFQGKNRNIFKGAIAWFAGALIAIFAFAMLRYRGWEDKIKRKLEAKIQAELEKKKNGGVDVEQPPEPTTRLGRAKARARSCLTTTTAPVTKAVGACWGATTHCTESCVASIAHTFGAGCQSVTNCCSRGLHKATGGRLGSTAEQQEEAAQQKAATTELGVTDAELQTVLTAKDTAGIFILIFATVLREGIESVVFLAGVGNAKPSSLPLPGIVGIICGVLLGVFLYYSGRQVKDIKWFIIIMALVLFFIAGGQFLLGADFLYQGGMFGYCSPWINDRPWTMQPLWEVKCCPDVDTKNKFFALMRAIFGYQDKPTFIEVMVYGIYWVVIFAMAAYKWYTGSLFDADYKYKRQQAKEAKQRAKEAAAAGLVDDTTAIQLELAKSSSAALGDAEVAGAKKLVHEPTASSLSELPITDSSSNSEGDVGVSTTGGARTSDEASAVGSAEVAAGQAPPAAPQPQSMQ